MRPQEILGMLTILYSTHRPYSKLISIKIYVVPHIHFSDYFNYFTRFSIYCNSRTSVKQSSTYTRLELVNSFFISYHLKL
nr:MAG TPA: hypothetical protein [Caudoviricetes sp.]